MQFRYCKWYKFCSHSPWVWSICLVNGRSRKTVLPCINFCSCCYPVLKISPDKPVVWLRLNIYPAVWEVCIPSGHVSFPVFPCSAGFVHCPVTAVICRSLAAPEALEHVRPAFLCISWDLQALGTDTFIAQTSKACSCCSNLGKQNWVSVAVSWKLLSWPFLMNTQLNVCVCSVSKSVFFVFFSGCLHAPLPQVYLYFSQWADVNEESWKRWGWSLAFRLLCACVLLSSLLGLRPERTDVYVIYASATLSCPRVLHAYCIANILFMEKSLI